jgi:opacity protein-like surface antigen
MVLGRDSYADDLNYLGVTLGDVRSKDLDSYDKTLPPNRVSLSDLDVSRAWLYGIRFGHMPERAKKMAAIEIEAFMITESDVEGENYYTDADYRNVNADGDISVKAIMLNFLLKNPSGKIRPYGGLGLGWTWFDMNLVLIGTTRGDETVTIFGGDLNDNTFGGQLLFGVEFSMTDAVFLELGYRYLYAKPEFVMGTVFDVKMTYRANIFTAGLRYTF